MWWVIDGNNVYGSKPDGWWNNRPAAQARLAQQIARWCRTHDHPVTVVFDPPLDPMTAECAGGNLTVTEAPRRGRNAADHEIVEIVAAAIETDPDIEVSVVTSDRGLRERLAPTVRIVGVGRFRTLIGY